MKCNINRSLARGYLVLAAFALSIGNVVAQDARSVVGTYAVVSSPPFGANPLGQMMLGRDGHYSLILSRAALPKIAAGARDKGTAEEDQAIVGGSIGHFGKYSVDSKDKTITFNIEVSTYPNWNGATFKRPLKVSGDELTYTNTAPSNGGAANDVVWKRVK